MLNIYVAAAQREEGRRVYPAVSGAAKAKPWFRLTSSICVNWVDTTRSHGSVFALHHSAAPPAAAAPQ